MDMNIEEKNRTIILSIYNDLSKVSDYSCILEDKKIQQAVNYVSFHSEKIALDNELIILTCDFHLDELIKSFLAYLRSQISTENITIFEFIFLFIRILKNFSKNQRFSDSFHQNNGLQIFFIFITDLNLIIKYFHNNRIQDDKYDKLLIEEVISCCLSLTRSFGNYKHKWKEIYAFESIIELQNIYEQMPHLRNSFCMIILSILEKDNMKKFHSVINTAIQQMIDLLKEITGKLDADKTIERLLVKFYDTDYEVLHFKSFNIIQLFEVFCRLVILDNGLEIYNSYNIKDYLKTVVFKGNQIEKSYAIKLLWQFCFDENIAKDVENDQLLINAIQNYENASEVIKDLRENSRGLIWLINKKMIQNDSLNEVEIFDIFIDHTNDCRDSSVKISQDLKNNGFKIWIDYEKINEPNLGIMTEAIRNSKCILILVSEMYKLSAYSRCVAEYGYKLNKPIIFLIMQENYKLDGWLSFICKTNNVLEFAINEYNQSIKKLKELIKNNLDENINALLKPKLPTKELINVNVNKERKGKYLNKMQAISITEDMSTELNKIVSVSGSINSNLNEEIEGWSREQVENWLIEKNFNKNLFDGNFPKNGKRLKELFDLLITSNEDFYSIADPRPSTNLPLTDVAYFALELKNVFRSKRFVRKS